MSESMAGVTFLALGNGSPDVFSTFAAMKIDSGSLAVGELIGAACFITAVVAGSMAIVRPFKVGKKSFVRDVSFFTVSILFGLFFLLDGRIQMWECVVMIMFYLCYVMFVIGWHWIAGRRKQKRRKERHAREHYTAPDEEEELLQDDDDEDNGVGGSNVNQAESLGVNPPDFGALERGGDAHHEEDEDEEEQEQREYAELSNNMRITRGGSERRMAAGAPHTIRPSLVGALEFRAVLNSLEKTKNLSGRQIHLRRYSDDPFLSAHNTDYLSTAAADAVVNVRHTPQSLLRPTGGPSGTGRTRAVSVNDIPNTDDFNPRHVPDLLVLESEDERTPAQSGQTTPSRLEVPEVRVPFPRLYIDPPQFLAPPVSQVSTPGHSPPVSAPVSPMSRATPRLIVSDADALSPMRLPRSSLDSISIVVPTGPKWRIFKYWPYDHLPSPEVMYDTFFPTLIGFSEKSFLEKAFALVAVPSVFFLALTLPVVDNPGGGNRDSPRDPKAQPHPSDSPRSMMSATTGAATPLMPPIDDGVREKEWNRWLVAIHCMTAPVFVVLVLFAEQPLTKPLLWALLVGLVSLGLLLVLTEPGRTPRLRYLLCFAGFAVAICWISTIAEEVVGILKAFGVILGISDAILGLTVFAVGNSLGDLVADITVARLGFPVMALSACFGGPMLNILLGVGVSGLYMTISRGDPVYRIEVSSTLVISAATLLVTLVVLLVWVPLNGWWMSRRIGWTLIGIWVLSTSINVAVEVMGIGTKWGGVPELRRL